MNTFMKINVSFGEMLFKLVKLHCFWLLFTLAGGVLLGFAPATVTAFRIAKNELVLKEKEYSLKEAWLLFKEEFFSANRVGLVLGAYFLFLYVDRRLLFQLELGSMGEIGKFVTFVLLLVGGLFLSNIFVLQATYQDSTKGYFVRSALLILAKPGATLINALFVLILMYGMAKFPFVLLVVVWAPIPYLTTYYFCQKNIIKC